MSNRKLGIKFIIRIIAATLLLVPILVGVWAFLLEPNRLVVKEETIQLPNWPTNFENLKIAVLSDLHTGAPFNDVEKLRYIVLKVNQTQPDLIVLLGDFIASVRGGE